MEPILPLISSGTEGPLGVKHLPRLWLKVSLAAAGRLPHGYKDIRPGFDLMVLEGLGIDPEAARAFINADRPSYPAFEAWLAAQPGADLSPENIASVNRGITSRTKAEDSRRRTLAKISLSETCPVYDSIMLNNLDDWHAVHRQLTESTR